MLRDYIETFPEEQQIGSASFKKIVWILTMIDQRAKKAMDYVSGVLVNDNFVCLGMVASKSSEADNIVCLIDVLDAFLKSTIDNHVSPCNVTLKHFALSSEMNES